MSRDKQINSGGPDRLIVGMTVGRGQKRSCYTILTYACRPDEGSLVWIRDNDSFVSVTNDAERVCKELAQAFGFGVRIIYADTDGHWDELVHLQGVFQDFRPARHLGVPL